MTRFSISQTLLAVAIGYLAFSIVKVANEIPNIIKIIEKTNVTVDKITPQIPSILDKVDSINLQVDGVVNEVALVRNLVEQQLPTIIEQVALSRVTVNDAIKQSKQYAKHLPDLLSHITVIEGQITELQQQLPHVLTRVDHVVEATKNTTQEVAKWRPQSQAYIEQIKYSREDIPMYLTRAENIVTDAKTIGKEASSGVFVGILKGALTLPFDVISGLTGIVDKNSRSAKVLTALDVSLMQEKTVALLNRNSQTESAWDNHDSGNHGTIVKGAAQYISNKVCHNLTFLNYFNDDSEELNELMCQEKDGLWKIVN